METTRLLHRSGVGITPDRTVREAAELMEQAGVGALAVVDHDHVIGIVTDRDLVRRAMARGLAGDTRVDAVMSTPPVTIAADADEQLAVRTFGTHGLRRLAVVGDRGQFVGMLTLDDLLIRLSEQLADLTRPITAEAMFAHRDPAVPVTA